MIDIPISGNIVVWEKLRNSTINVIRPEFEIFKSNHGGKILACGGYNYHMDKAVKDSIYWKCVKNRAGCKGRNKTFNNHITFRGEHNHGPDPRYDEVRRYLSLVKERALSTLDSPSILLSKALETVPESVRPILPSISTTKRTIQRLRKNAKPIYRPSLTLSKITVSDACKCTSKSEKFLFCDKTIENERILMFGSESGLKCLKYINKWVIEGTYKDFPQQLCKFYTIHAIVSENLIPIVFILISAKTVSIFKEMTSCLKLLLENRSPDIILTDFDKELIKEFNESFPDTSIHCCFYYFCQNIWEKINSLPEVSRLYSTNLEFMIKTRLLISLAFVPIPDIRSSFDAIRSDPFVQENYSVYARLFEHFEKYYIGKTVSTNFDVTNPVFPIKSWNCFDSSEKLTFDFEIKLEKWHKELLVHIGNPCPGIIDFFHILKNIESHYGETLTKLDIEKINIKTKRKPEDTEVKISKTIRNYNENDIISYLTQISYIISI